MSGIIAWLTGFLDGSVGKYTFRSTTFRSDTFASGCWAGVREITPTGILVYVLADTRPMWRVIDIRPSYVLSDGRLDYRVRAEP
jgi:hypothetical protein